MESQQASMEKAGAGAGRGRERGQRQQPICNLIAKRGQRQADCKCSLASQSSRNGETWVQRERDDLKIEGGFDEDFAFRTGRSKIFHSLHIFQL